MDICSVTVDGAEVVYAQKGTTANPPLLLVHGWGASHRVWNGTMGELYLGYRCIAPDLPGFGVSDKPARFDYTIPGFAKFLGRFLDVLEIDRVDLVGHSMGGATALEFALANPGRVGQLCVINPPIRGSDSFFGFAKFGMLPGIRRFLHLGCRLRLMRRFVARDFTYKTKLPLEVIDDLRQGTFRSMTRPVRSMMGLDVSPRLRDVRVPTLFIGTDQDKVIQPGQHDLWPREEPLRYAEIKDCGHMPMLEEPAQFNRILRDYLIPAPAEIPVG